MHRDHELHTRRRGRNFGLLAVLLAFIVIVFGVTVVKVRTGGFAEGFDHVARPALVPEATREVTE
ncbi:hypothetical protein [Jannaschia sp. S6380]|uniref:hypothetical protein n=1 Tax=Jannaschia sp. S6380 TaxID=2926408 RepID=UPI00248C0517|nr:hypothetical protein [Jannaschia sp. S6380]